MNRFHAYWPRPRRGFTIPELLVASFVLGVAMVSSVQISGALGRARNEARHRQQALAEADNCLERLSAMPWEELTPARAAECGLSADAAAQLPAGKLKVEITALDEQPPAKRILVEVRWRDVRGEPLAPVRLTAWVYERDPTSAEGK